MHRATGLLSVLASDTSQAAAVSKSCLNPILDSDTLDNMVDVVNCGDTVWQQDGSGQASAPITHQTANPTDGITNCFILNAPGLSGLDGGHHDTG
jgi:hypothetical protein